MGKAIILLPAVILVLAVSVGNAKRQVPAGAQPQPAAQASIDQSALQVAIASVDPMLQAADHYRVGEQVIVTISMVNTAKETGYVCVSSDMYQDLPTLTRNGRPLPYAKWQTQLLSNVQLDHTCRDVDLPERLLLNPNEPAVVDFLTIVDDSRNSTGVSSWYDPLTPGIYEFSIRRRLACCEGPMIESNKISFEVVP